MPKTVTWDYIDETSFEAEKPEAARAVAKEFLALARDPETEYEDDTSPAALFISASECFYDALDPISAYEAAREAQDAEGDVAPDKRVYLIEGLLRTGQTAEADELAKAIRAERPNDPDVYSFLGDSYDAAGDLANGQRWYNMGIKMVEKIIDEEDDLDREELADVLEARELLLLGRQLIRHEAGLEPDELDEEALEILEEYDDEDEDQK
jgi:tetratricopeptide (TPR) repeat protein